MILYVTHTANAPMKSKFRKRHLEARRKKATMVDISRQEGVETICWDGATRRSYVEVNDIGWSSEGGGHYVLIDGERVPVRVRMFARRLHAISLAAVDERSWDWVDAGWKDFRERLATAIPQRDDAGVANLIEDMLAQGVQCPLCGWGDPHRHSGLEIVCYRNGIKWGQTSRRLLREAGEKDG